MPGIIGGAIDLGVGLFGGGAAAGGAGALGGIEGALGGLGSDLAGLFGLGEGAAGAGGIAAAAPSALPAAAGAAPDLASSALGFQPFDFGAFGATGAPGYGTAAPDAISGALNLSGASPVDASGISAIAPDTASIPGQVGSNVGGQAGTDISALIGGGPGSGGGSTNVLQQLIQNPMGTLGEGAAQSLIKNPLGIALGAGGLGVAMAGNKNPLNTREGVALEHQAYQLNDQGKMLQSYLTTGTLPPALQTQLTQATQAAKATIISRYAQQGLPTDPSKNSTLAQELAQVDTNAIAATAKIGQDLLTTGISETGLSSNIYNMLLGINQTQTANFAKSIANFASAFGGGPKIQIGGTSGA
jgi:hypothetical protein